MHMACVLCSLALFFHIIMQYMERTHERQQHNYKIKTQHAIVFMDRMHSNNSHINWNMHTKIEIT